MRKSGLSLLLAPCIAAAIAATATVQAQVQPAGSAMEAPSAAALDPREVSSRLAELLERDYVLPEVGRRYAAMLRANAGRGLYDGLDRHGLADRLTQDLRGLSPDNHLRVAPDPGPGGATARGPRAMMPPGAPPPIEQAGWIAPGIAFIRFNVFPPDTAVTEAAQRFMAEHADARAIIFDLRTHGGGGIDQMDAIFPYLFARETVLVAMETRASVAQARREPIADRRTMRRVDSDGAVVRREHVAFPHETERRLFETPVFVLTSGRTGSAAEHFALAMKRTGRATLIGEPTGGANHYGGMQPLGGGLSAFIPVGRTVDPDTGQDWEGAGIAPDVAVPAERALVEALVRAGVPAAEAESLSADHAPSRPMRRIS